MHFALNPRTALSKQLYKKTLAAVNQIIRGFGGTEQTELPPGDDDCASCPVARALMASGVFRSVSVMGGIHVRTDYGLFTVGMPDAIATFIVLFDAAFQSAPNDTLRQH